MTIQNHDHHSDYGPAQLALFGAASIVILVFVWAVVALTCRADRVFGDTASRKGEGHDGTI